MKFDSLLFGTAGIPLSTAPSNTVNGVKHVRALGLDAMELEFVRSVNVSEELAPQVKRTAQEGSVALTCHASYFINLNSSEKKKREASKKRILDAARRAWECGAFSVCFHAAFYQKQEPGKVYSAVKDSLQEIVSVLRAEKNEIWVRPETTGKRSQFGSLEELVELSSELDGVLPCIDFSHLHARSAGKMNSAEEFRSALELVEKKLGKNALKEMHCHVSGIAYSDKGEKHHLNLEESDLKYRELLRALKEFGCKGVVISESPNIEGDALLLKKEFSGL